jgi:hypothetical protein
VRGLGSAGCRWYRFGECGLSFVEENRKGWWVGGLMWGEGGVSVSSDMAVTS